MGRVYVARHVHLDRNFAIKFIGLQASHAPDIAVRFEKEVLALGKLQHPNILSAVDAGSVDGVKYLVTELINGEDLAQLVRRRGPLPCADACELIRQAALGLAHSHNAGFLHRDLKPSNLILDRTGVVKLLDFGLVCQAEANHELTSHGGMLGTWDFVAPEQAQDARQVDARSDLYSLGCTLIYLLSGKPPFCEPDYSTAASKLKGHMFDLPPWLEQVPDDLPTSVEALLIRLVAKNPAERFQYAAAVAEALGPPAADAQLATLFELPATVCRGPAMKPAAPRQCQRRSANWRRYRTPIAAAALAAAVPCAWFATSSLAPKASPSAPAPIFAPAVANTGTTSETATELKNAEVAASSAVVTGELKTTTSAGAVHVDLSKSAPNKVPIGFGDGP